MIMEHVILDDAEVDQQFIEELKEILQDEIKVAMECAFQYKDNAKNHIRRSKLKQYALKQIIN